MLELGKSWGGLKLFIQKTYLGVSENYQSQSSSHPYRESQSFSTSLTNVTNNFATGCLGFRWRIRRRRKNRISETIPDFISGRRHRSTEDTETFARRASIERCIVVSFCSMSTYNNLTWGVSPNNSFNRPICVANLTADVGKQLSIQRAALGKKSSLEISPRA